MRLKDALFTSFNQLYNTDIIAGGVQSLVGPAIHTAVDGATYIRIGMPMHRLLDKQVVFDMATINIVEEILCS